MAVILGKSLDSWFQISYDERSLLLASHFGEKIIEGLTHKYG